MFKVFKVLKVYSGFTRLSKYSGESFLFDDPQQLKFMPDVFFSDVLVSLVLPPLPPLSNKAKIMMASNMNKKKIRITRRMIIPSFTPDVVACATT